MTYTGKTAIVVGAGSSGTKTIQNGGGTNNVENTNITLNDNVIIDDSGTFTLGGVISESGGSFGLTKSNSGTTTLSGANTYTGTTTISAGTLELSGGSAIADTGHVQIADVAGATLHLNADETIGSLAGGGTTGGNVDLDTFTLTTGDAGNDTYSGSISGSGAFTKDGAGTLILTGANTYTGETKIDFGGGTLQLGDGGADGSLSSSSAIRINGVNNRFAVNQSDTVTQGTDFGAAAISGNGGFTQAGSGTTILNAVNTYTGGTEVDAGILEIAGTGQLGSGAYDGNISIASGATFKYNSSAAQTLSGRIDGAGDFVKDSSSVLTLSGQIKNHTGSTTINAGTIIAGDTDQYGSTSKYFINSGALLQMNGFSNVERNIGGLNDGVSGGGTVENGAATDVTLTLDSTGDHSFSGVIRDGSGGGALSLALKFADTQTLTGNNTFTGDISGGNQAELMIDGAGTLGWNGSVGDYAGNITLAQGADFTYASSADQTLSGVISDDGGGDNIITMSGSGTLTLTGTNTYTGRTNISTTLEIQNSEALGTGLVRFNRGR